MHSCLLNAAGVSTAQQDAGSSFRSLLAKQSLHWPSTPTTVGTLGPCLHSKPAGSVPTHPVCFSDTRCESAGANTNALLGRLAQGAAHRPGLCTAGFQEGLLQQRAADGLCGPAKLHCGPPFSQGVPEASRSKAGTAPEVALLTWSSAGQYA